MMGSLHVRLLIALKAFLVFASATANGQAVYHPTLCWVNSFLLNQIMVEEYISLIDASADSTELRAKLQTSKQGLELLKRATFAVTSAAELKQYLGETVPLRSGLFTHKATLKQKNKIFFDEIVAFEQQMKKPNGYEVAISTFRDLKIPFDEQEIKSFYSVKPATCEIEDKEVGAFVAMQLKITENRQAVRGNDIFGFLKGWSLEKTRCLAIFLLNRVDENHNAGYDPRALLETIAYSSHPWSQDQSLQILLAIRLVQKHNYAEVLRVLYKMRDTQKSIRIPYELVQRIYNYRQKGQGSVALQQM